MQSKRRTSLGLAAAFMALASMGWADILSDNLSEATADLEYLSGPVQVAAGFKTDNQSYTLDNVMLWLGNPVPGQAALSLYSDNASQPGSLIGTLISPSLYFPDLASMTFGGNNLFLDANTSYWIVLQALSGQFTWGWTESSFGSGPGFLGNWAVSTSPGAWTTFDSEPTQMQVNATATPEPSSLALLGAGLLGLGLFAQRKRTVQAVKPLVLAAVAVTLPASAAIAQPKPDRTLLTVNSPKLGESVRGPFAKIDVAISSAANRGTFLAKLNGRDVTNLFSRSGHCRGAVCSETATLTPAFGLVHGTNIMRLRIERFDGRYHYERLRFNWSATPVGLGDTLQDQPSVYTFTTLTPGGPIGDKPWFQISSTGLYGTTTTYPADPTTCTTRYTLILIDRQSLAEISKNCLEADGLAAMLPAIPMSQFAVVGTGGGRNADYTTLNLLPIGGTDMRSTSQTLDTPLGLMAIGIGPVCSADVPPNKCGGTPYGIARQSYYTQNDLFRNVTNAVPQINGVLTLNAHNYYDFHPSDDILYTVDGPNKQIVINGATYTPPTPPATGFWVLRLNRMVLQDPDCTSSDGGLTYPGCGEVYDFTDPAQIIELGEELQGSTWRELLFIVGWGQQPGYSYNTDAVAAMGNLGIPYTATGEMTSPDSVLVAVTSPDPEVSKGMIDGQIILSNTANAQSGQNGKIVGLLSRDMYQLYRPSFSAQQNSDTSHPIDPSIIQIAYSPAKPWPVMDTPGRVAAYKYWSYKLITYVWTNPPAVNLDDIRYLYTFPTQSALLKGLKPLNIASITYPDGGSFTRPDTGDTYVFSMQDYTDVGNQLNNELGDLAQVLDFLGDGDGLALQSLLIEGSNSGVLSLFSGVANITADLNAPTSTKVAADMGNILNMAGAVVSIAASIAQPELAPALGVAAGVLWAAGSAGLVDSYGGTGIPLPEYSLLLDASDLADNYKTYLQHADSAYDTMLDNILSDWYKMDAVSYGSNNQWLVPKNVDKTEITNAVGDGASRYFYTKLAASVYSLDVSYLQPNLANGQSPTPSLLGSWTTYCDGASHQCFRDKCRSQYPYSSPANGWASFSSYPAENKSDIFIIGGPFSNNSSNNMAEQFLSGSILDKIFDTYKMPLDQFYLTGPLPTRAPPAYSDTSGMNEFGYCRVDQN